MDNTKLLEFCSKKEICYTELVEKLEETLQLFKSCLTKEQIIEALRRTKLIKTLFPYDPITLTTLLSIILDNLNQELSYADEMRQWLKEGNDIFDFKSKK